MKEARTEFQDEITGAGVEEAVIGFFGRGNLTAQGHHTIGDKHIEIVRDEKKKILSATATLNGVSRAVIKSYYGSLFTAYFRLLGEEDINGVRDEAIYNRRPFGREEIELFRGPGVDLSKKQIVNSQAERLEIARRLGIKLNVPPPHKVRVLR